MGLVFRRINRVLRRRVRAGDGQPAGFCVRPLLRLRFFSGERFGKGHQFDHQSCRADVFYPARPCRVGMGDTVGGGEFMRRRGRCALGNARRN